MKRIITIVCLSIIVSFSIVSQVRLPKLISDGMVLQRNAPVKLWGWASAGELIVIQFVESTYKTITDRSGNWNIVLPKMKAGGPYELKITSNDTVIIHDILIGDVWLASGQSNMELPMKRVSWNYPGEIESSENKFIRQFIVPQRYNFNFPENDVPHGSWKSANPANIPDFSAAAYFFAKELYGKYKIPIGILNASLGGSPAESWISEEAIKKFPVYFDEAQKYKDSMLIKNTEESDNKRIREWNVLLRQKDEGYADSAHLWISPSMEISDWKSMNIPGYWAESELGNVNGVVWFRKNINIPSTLEGKSAQLILGRIVDADSVFVNGVFVGTVSYQYPPRRYTIPEGVLSSGTNTIVIRVINSSGRGGFVPDKQYALVLSDTTINLVGPWKYRLGAVMESLAGQTFIRWKPVGLFNGMISPLLNYRIKGAIWYQGESNAKKPDEYKELLSTMIKDWRKRWGQGDFPFVIAQLPNFMEPKTEPSESNWALLREAQLQTLSVPNTGLAVMIDIGEWNDIHPLNKKDVGIRLALSAEKIAYGEQKLVSSGPMYKSMKVKGKKIVISFTNTGSGLTTNDGEKLRHFAIAGEDKKFVWADASIEKNTIIVWSNQIKKPIAVRYAWQDNPAAVNLYNKEGLPASPFRTDQWK